MSSGKRSLKTGNVTDKGPISVASMYNWASVIANVAVPRLYSQVSLVRGLTKPEERSDTSFSADDRNELCTMIKTLAGAYHYLALHPPNGVKTANNIKSKYKPKKDKIIKPKTPDEITLGDSSKFEEEQSLRQRLETGETIEEITTSVKSPILYSRELIEFINDNVLFDDQPEITIHNNVGGFLYATTITQYLARYADVHQLKSPLHLGYYDRDKINGTSLGDLLNSEWRGSGLSLAQAAGIDLNQSNKTKQGKIVIGVRGFGMSKISSLCNIKDKPFTATRDDVRTIDLFASVMTREKDKVHYEIATAKKKIADIKADQRKADSLLKKEATLKEKAVRKAALITPKKSPAKISPPKKSPTTEATSSRQEKLKQRSKRSPPKRSPPSQTS